MFQSNCQSSFGDQMESKDGVVSILLDQMHGERGGMMMRLRLPLLQAFGWVGFWRRFLLKLNEFIFFITFNLPNSNSFMRLAICSFSAVNFWLSVRIWSTSAVICAFAVRNWSISAVNSWFAVSNRLQSSTISAFFRCFWPCSISSSLFDDFAKKMFLIWYFSY